VCISGYQLGDKSDYQEEIGVKALEEKEGRLKA
jgi:hypothetical protein